MAWQGTIVFFDLQTTGLDTKSCHIVQLGASCKNTIFNATSSPASPSNTSYKVNGLTVSYGQLLLHGSLFPGPVLLAAHNAWGFDQILLMRVLRKFSLSEQFEQVVSGFVDTLPLSRKLHPQLKWFNQPYLVRCFLRGKYNAYNAVDNAKQLEELFWNYWEPYNDVISEFTDWFYALK
ncbi:DNA polymerase III PolC-type [Dissostichus eleginoides]|uniref:exodeoxyribonuclease III n=1 Tax=Dissostichus eleginoides TaxID=100907 RepID=A0AAD9F0M6_DISEL|nr:DNA polymerase III PolC-type [Dissostichus eleginoides]